MSFAQALEPPAVEKRTLRRNRVLLAARFVHGDKRQFTTACILRNITASGAAVRVEGDLPLPPELSLIEERSGRAHRVRIVWRRGGYVGLAFTGTQELRAAPPSDPLRRLWAVNQMR